MTSLGEQIQDAIVVNDGSSALRREPCFSPSEEPLDATAGDGEQALSGQEVGNQPGGQVVRILLTPEQCRIMNEGGGVETLFGRILGDASADIRSDGEGRIILNLHLKYTYGTRMLTSIAVMEMLQISRAMLSRLVKDGKVRSYKIGRLRRFMLEDILEYISRNNELNKLLPAEPQ